MLRRTIHIATLLFVAHFSGCNKHSVMLSDQDPDRKPRQGLEATGATPPEEIVAEENTAPKQWPKCWLSFRLGVATSFYLAGQRSQGWIEPTFKASDGRQKLTGKAKNPTVEGDCVMNWFQQDHSQEPWVALFQQEFPRYQAVVTCTASSTPDCSCGSTLPIDIAGYWVSEERCVRKSGQGYELYHVREPDSRQTVPNEGRCDAAQQAVESISKTNLRRDDFQQKTQDRPEMGGAGQTCRTDFEPFAPLDDEKDWYASSIRDWAVTSCQDQATSCRCYAIYNKSSFVDGAPSSQFDLDTCLLCKEGVCQFVDM